MIKADALHTIYPKAIQWSEPRAEREQVATCGDVMSVVLIVGGCGAALATEEWPIRASLDFPIACSCFSLHCSLYSLHLRLTSLVTNFGYSEMASS
jgi:hypothetical protein